MSAAAEPGAALPEVQDAVLDAPTLARLFTDLELGADVREIVYKQSAAAADAAPGPRDLAAAHHALAQRRVLGVQIRYLFGGRQWCDTLLPTAAGVRLVRIAQD
jgi:hypothetical protein